MIGDLSENMTEQDKQWQRESDARTLSEAEAIKADTNRLSDAVTESKKQADKKAQEAMQMKKVSQSFPSTAYPSMKGL